MDRIEQLVCLDDVIRKTGESICIQEAVWEAEILPGMPVYVLLFDDAQSVLCRDARAALSLALDRASSINDADLELNAIRGILGAFSIDEEGELNAEADWIALIRSHLCVEPGSPEYFCEQCKIAFPLLKFSNEFPACITTFDGGYEKNVVVVSDALAALNEKWSLEGEGDLPRALKSFSIESGFPTTLEGNGDRKEDLTFTFEVNEFRSEKVLCEPHMKLGSSGLPGDNSYHFHRIYFSPRGHGEFPGKILVGHAGKHL